MGFKTLTKLVIARSPRDFQSEIHELSSKGYYPSQSGLSIHNRLVSIIPLRIEVEYMILMQKVEKADDGNNNQS